MIGGEEGGMLIFVGLWRVSRLRVDSEMVMGSRGVEAGFIEGGREIDEVRWYFIFGGLGLFGWVKRCVSREKVMMPLGLYSPAAEIEG